MESLVEGVNSLHSLGYNPSVAETNRPPLPFSAKHHRRKRASSATIIDNGIDATQIPKGLVRNICNAASEMVGKDVEDTSQFHPQSNKGNLKFVHASVEADQTKVNYSQKCASLVYDSNSRSLVEAADLVISAKEVVADEDSPVPSKARVGCPSPQKSTTKFTESKQSFTNTEVSECASSMAKSIESSEVSYSCDFAESRKTGIRDSTGSDINDDSSSSSFSSAINKPHKSNDSRWESIQAIRSRDGNLGLNTSKKFLFLLFSQPLISHNICMSYLHKLTPFCLVQSSN